MDPNGLLSMSLELNVARKCRICGMDIHDLTCAFPIFGSDRLDTKIQRYLQLNITRDDLLPKCVCGSCYLKLESIDQFAVMANRTDDAFRAWISRLRGLNSPEEAGRSVNVALPIFRPQQQSNTLSQAVDDKGSIILQPQPVNVTRPKPGPKGNIAQSGTPALTPSVVSYSDLKLGLLIKDQELLKLILKALKWAENDRRASFDVLIQRLKNSSFREVLSNHNLLNDSDLTQLLKSYIGQGVMSSFLPMPATSGNQYVLNNNVPPPLVPLQPTIAQPINEDFVGLQRIKLPPSTPKPSGTAGVPDLQIDEASVTQMEVGVDPDLYFPYEDEDSSSTTKYENTKLEDRQENTVTIKLMSTNVAGDLVENKRMIPAILNVRGSNRFQCSACPECFPTNPDLQQHIVTSHLSKGNRTVPTEQGKPAIKIRVKKTKPAVIMVPKPMIAPPPPVVIMTSTESSRPVPATVSSQAVLHQSAPSISIAPLKIPASTTITMVPGPVKTEPDPATSQTQPETDPVSSVPTQKTPLKESPPKVGLVRKSKRKLSIKLELSPHSAPEKKKQKAKDRESTPTVIKSPRRALTSFCALCRKRLAPSDNIRKHMQQEHSRYQCEKCDRSFKSAVNLARHQHCHEETGSSTTDAVKPAPQKTSKSPQTDPHTHNCSFCGRIFKRSHHLKVQSRN
ncbi:AGAP008515-PA-like protein [Anopheles sinensis]|uniref:AGAP008515-PA-like protein n=1 Tax=Anopheles sinensis TaxID=74873 RepID=A0A084VBF0_ANOSI|nr:AGAP008515-PA-like protein [Anopheles sinensis]